MARPCKSKLEFILVK